MATIGRRCPDRAVVRVGQHHGRALVPQSWRDGHLLARLATGSARGVTRRLLQHELTDPDCRRHLQGRNRVERHVDRLEPRSHGGLRLQHRAVVERIRQQPESRLRQWWSCARVQ